MKNIHILPTDQPSRLWINNLLQGKLELSEENLIGSNTARHIYITSDEDIKEGDFAFFLNYNTRHKAESKKGNIFYADDTCKKIILTTDPTLIAEGVQSIDDEFLEWFVKNPTCEFVEVSSHWLTIDLENWINELPLNEINEIKNKTFDDKLPIYYKKNNFKEIPIDSKIYRIYLPIKKEQQEKSLEEAADKYFPSAEKIGGETYTAYKGFKAGANYQAEKMYSEEDLRQAFRDGQSNMHYSDNFGLDSSLTEQQWFENFKKK